MAQAADVLAQVHGHPATTVEDITEAYTTSILLGFASVAALLAKTHSGAREAPPDSRQFRLHEHEKAPADAEAFSCWWGPRTSPVSAGPDARQRRWP
jgi:hypothetical protein